MLVKAATDDTDQIGQTWSSNTRTACLSMKRNKMIYMLIITAKEVTPGVALPPLFFSGGLAKLGVVKWTMIGLFL